MTNTIFNNTTYDLGGGLTIGGSGKNVSSANSGWNMARTTPARNVGAKLYAEFALTTLASANNAIVGVSFNTKTIGVLVNCSTNTVTFTYDGVNFTGGYVWGISGAVKAMVSLVNSANAALVNFGGTSFVFSVPGGASAWGASDTLANVGSNGTVTGGTFLTCTSGWTSATSGLSKSSGSWYFELTASWGTDNNGIMIGVGNGSANLNSYAGSDGNSCGYQCQNSNYGWASVAGPSLGGWIGFLQPSTFPGYPSPIGGQSNEGNVYYGTGSEYLAAFDPANQGEVIGMAVDTGAGAVWYCVNGGRWNGNSSNNPATAVGGLAFTPGTYMSLAVGLFNSGSEVTIATGYSAFAYSAPSGFTAWDGGTPPSTGGNWVNISCVC